MEMSEKIIKRLLIRGINILSEKEQLERGIARANASNNFLLEENSKQKHEYEIKMEAAIDLVESEIKDCNPEHFFGNQMFIKFMDDPEIGSFGDWQFANGFNMGITAAKTVLKNLQKRGGTE